MTRKVPEAAFKLLKEENYTIELWNKADPPTKKELIQKCKQADALLSMLSDKLDKEFFEACSHLKVVSNYAVGVNNIDLKAAAHHNIPIGNTPDVLLSLIHI